MTQSVYLIRCAGFIKIGVSRDPEGRLRTIQICSPFACVLEAVIAVSAGLGPALEAELHKRFADQHERGEWFRIEGELLEALPALIEENSPKPTIAELRSAIDLLGAHVVPES